MPTVFTCTHCNAVPEQIVEGKAQLAIVRHRLECPTLLAQTRTRWAERTRRGSASVHVTARTANWQNWAVGQHTAAAEGWVSESRPERADSGSCQLRLVAGARRATPRRIHGVRLAITSMARSDRRIAVRAPGVGVDTSVASADPAGGP